jgi:hypothetical protein
MGEPSSYSFHIQTDYDPDGTIRSMLNGTLAHVLQTQETQVQTALIALGWRPPAAPDVPDWQSIATEAMRLLQAHIGSWRDDEVKALEDRFRAAGGSA